MQEPDVQTWMASMDLDVADARMSEEKQIPLLLTFPSSPQLDSFLKPGQNAPQRGPGGIGIGIGPERKKLHYCYCLEVRADFLDLRWPPPAPGVFFAPGRVVQRRSNKPTKAFESLCLCSFTFFQGWFLVWQTPMATGNLTLRSWFQEFHDSWATRETWT
ncbi:unnamed protein product [Prorocentrum cordatum]|uniref:Uncharacterized protein n=1 Tax=Prorocentrum cordatum TaxID=2364126 RepID=A0ABN9TPB2_9DINO|nr:unnamed protein product [Polarella glacialis]